MNEVINSSGNIFKDLGFENHNELKTKAELARQISVAIKLNNLKQKEAEKITGVNQGDISKIVNGYCEKFSIDRMFNMLLNLGQDVRVNIQPAKGHKPFLQITGAA
jgi:predicted XRE-type DNA-binding protein